jgi:hypothetical protein
LPKREAGKVAAAQAALRDQNVGIRQCDVRDDGPEIILARTRTGRMSIASARPAFSMRRRTDCARSGSTAREPSATPP